MRKLLDRRAVAAVLGVTPRTLDRWRALGYITASKVGRAVRFEQSEVERMVQTMRERN